MGDREDEANQRCQFNSGTRQPIVLALQDFLHEHNKLIRVFRTALDRMPTDEYAIIIRADETPVGQHAGCFNAPTSNEVAVITVGDHVHGRDILIQCRHGDLHRISEKKWIL